MNGCKTELVIFECYVCKKKIAENPVHIGEGLCRHQRCKPGSKKWMASESTKNSYWRQFFEKKGE